MSRTYRHIRGFEYRDWVRTDAGYYDYVRIVKLEGKRLAKARADGRYWEPHGWYFNQCHRVRRRNDQQELHKAYTCADFEDYCFDDSHAVRKWKGIWWEIY